MKADDINNNNNERKNRILQRSHQNKNFIFPSTPQNALQANKIETKWDFFFQTDCCT